METFKLNTKYIDNIECYIENLGTELNPRFAAKDIRNDEIQLILNVVGYAADEYITVKDYSENEGLTDCLIKEGLIESKVYSVSMLKYTEVKTYKITDKFRKCIKKR